MTDLGIEDPDAAFARALDLAHRAGGIDAQAVVVAAMLRIQADADRGGRKDLVAVDDERLLQPDQKLLHPRFDRAGGIDRRDQQDELVATGAREDIARPDDACDPLRDPLEQAVADGMAIVVVDVLEIVDVDDGDREDGVGCAGFDQRLNRLLDQPAIGKPGEIVDIGALEQTVLEAALLGHVDRRRDMIGGSADGDDLQLAFQHAISLGAPLRRGVRVERMPRGVADRDPDRIALENLRDRRHILAGGGFRRYRHAVGTSMREGVMHLPWKSAIFSGC